MAPNKITTLSAMVLMCGISPLALKTASAQETQPGDACVVGETGHFRRAGDDSPGPTIDGQNFMFCDGANWLSFLQYDNVNSAMMLRAPAAAPPDAILNNSHWSLWLDETNDEFELKARKSDGTYIAATVGLGGGGGLWTDNTTYITDTSSGTHLIKTGQTLPAVLDDAGTRMFFYPDKAAFRGGTITTGFRDDAWQEANIGTHSFAWGDNNEASGNYSVAMGSGNTASGDHSFAMGWGSTASGNRSFAMGGADASGRYGFATTFGNANGYGSVSFGSGRADGTYSFSAGYGYALSRQSVAMSGGVSFGLYSFSAGSGARSTGGYSTALGRWVSATGENSIALGSYAIAGDGLFVGGSHLNGSLNPSVGVNSMAFGLMSDSMIIANQPTVTGNRAAVFFFDSNVNGAMDNYDFTASDRLGLVGGQLQIGETQLQGAAAGCIRFEPTANQLEWSNDCTAYSAFGGGGGLWTDNTTYVTQADSNAHLIKTGQTLPAVLDDAGTRMFFYPDKAAFRGGVITGANTAWQEANIGTNSFSWGTNSEASGNYSIALGFGDATDTGAVAIHGNASGRYSFAVTWGTASGYGSTAFGDSTATARYSISSGYGIASGGRSVALGSGTASAAYSVALGLVGQATGKESLALGAYATAGDGLFIGGNASNGSLNADVGENSMAFGLISNSVPIAAHPKVTGDRSAVFFFDHNIAASLNNYDFTASDRLGLVGGQLQIGERQDQGAAAGCIRFEPTANQLEYSNDCTAYSAFGGGSSLWTDNTTHITRENFNIIDAGQTLPAGFDALGSRAFYYPDKQAFRGGEIVTAQPNVNAWQEANIGTHSFAWGLNPEVSGGHSVAFGWAPTASGDYSVAMGLGGEATGYGSVSIGPNYASGRYSFAMGTGTSSNYHSVSFGSSSASAQYSVAMGQSLASGDYSVAMGGGSTASGNRSVAMGGGNTASGNHSVAMGYYNAASGNHSVAMGREVVAGSGTAGDGAGDGVMAFGLQTASHATEPRVTGDRTMALFFDGGVANANSTVNVTADDALIIYGGRVGIGMTATPSVELDVVGDIEYTGTIADVSDRRLKTEIENLKTNQLQKILDLQGVSFKMKDDLEGPLEFGFIAQDVQLLYPDLVYEREDGMFSMNYVGLIAPMVEAMEEQSNIIELQKSRIDLLEERLKSLEVKLNGATIHGLTLALLLLGL